MTSFTVAICTHDRAASLARALAALTAARRPDAAWDVLVVLNACGDGSRAVVDRARGTLPVRAVAEPFLGLSHARNRAVREIAADYVIFVDDDAVVGDRFLVAYAKAFRRWPEADVFGGAILPRFAGTPPAWLIAGLPGIGSAYAAREVPADGATVTPDLLPYGTNFAMRMRCQRSHPYDPALGRGPVDWIRNGEETEVLLAALAAGADGRWVAEARVDHIVPPERQTLDYLWQYYEGYGRLLRLKGRQRRALPMRVVWSYLAYRWARLTGTPEAWGRALVRAAVRRGEWKARADVTPARPRAVAAATTSP